MHCKKALTTAELVDIKSRILALQEAPLLELEFDPADLNLDLTQFESPARPSKTRCVPVVATNGTKKISIRVSARLLAAFRLQAEKTGTGYQTLINQTLQVAALGWGSV